MASLWDLIIKSAEAGEKLQAKDGSMPAGHNGPWHDKDTPVRNTANWAITFAKAYEITGRERFKQSAMAACEYLLTEEARPSQQAFYCRNSTKKDRCNGLIGQVWAIEPFLVIGRDFGKMDYVEMAKTQLLGQPFDEKLKLWKVRDITGEIYGIMNTFNQQLWFAQIVLAVAKSTGNKILYNRSSGFFENLDKKLRFIERGLLLHELPYALTNSIWNIRNVTFKKLLRKIERLALSIQNASNDAEKKKLDLVACSVGYLSFNLYGFASAYSESKGEAWWQKSCLQRALQEMFEYVQSESYYQNSHATDYGWAYNPIGFEVAYALHTFQDLLSIDGSTNAIRPWVEQQFEHHWNPASGLLERNTQDPKTLSARLYEATHLPNMELHLSME